MDKLKKVNLYIIYKPKKIYSTKAKDPTKVLVELFLLLEIWIFEWCFLKYGFSSGGPSRGLDGI